MSTQKFINQFLVLLIFFFSTLSFFPQSIYAVTDANAEIKTAQNKICLKSDQDMTSTVPSAEGQFNLKGTGFQDADTVYVALCLPSAEKTVCSTGTPQLDKEIFGSDFTKDIQNLEADAGSWGGYQYGLRNTGNISFTVTPNKIKPTGGKIETNVSMSGVLGHFVFPFYGFFGMPSRVLELGSGGQQQGTFTFEGATSECTSILWDPYGRIFDSQSLEPIPQVKVKALTQVSPLEKLAQTFGNPQTTIEDGAFNFLVEPGTYYLRLVNPPLKYAFTSNPNLHPNYKKVYSKRDGTNSIYKPDEPIIEKPKKPEHRDIPMDPGKNSPGRYPIVNIKSHGFHQMTMLSASEYGGKISHPLSIVALVGQKSKKEIKRTVSDKFGYWNIVILNNAVPQYEPLVIKLVKVDLTTMKSDERNAVITSDVVFNPILRSVKGYVYEDGKPIPNAPVKVTLDSNNKVFYQTKSDEDGFISISSSNLPIFAYSLSVLSPVTNKVMKIETGAFAEENLPYLEKNKINLMKMDSKSDAKSDSNTSQQNPGSQNEQSKETLNQKSETSDFNNNRLLNEQNNINNKFQKNIVVQNQNNTLLITIILLIIFGVTVVGLVLIYIKRKEMNQVPDEKFQS